MPRLLLLAALVLMLAACDSGGADVPGSVSADEAKALEEAAEMLDERQLPPEALPTDASTEAPPAEMTGDAAPTRR